MSKRITILDIARAVGVDNSTVSLALRDDGRITEATRQRVREAARRLNYVPNQLARSLSGGRSRLVGVMLTDMENRFFSPALEEFQTAAERNGIALSVQFCSWNQEREERGIEQFCGSQVEGIIWAPTDGGSERYECILRRMQSAMIPCVLFGLAGRPDRVTAHQVGVSEREAIRAGLEYLHSLHHQRMGVATAVSATGMRSTLHRNRLAHMRLVAGELGMTIDDQLVWDTEDNTYGGVEIAARLVRMPLPQWPTAVFASDDMLGRALLSGLRALGVRVPEEISVLGFDDAPDDSTGPVSLTSVSLEARQNGAETFALLMGLIGGTIEAEPRRVVKLSPRIVQRASCAAV
jgi:LacI family transcriptional regulator